MSKEEILNEYFLVETEKTEEIRGWKVIGCIESCSSQSVSPIIELKTDGDAWLCDFKVKLLHCGLVLVSPEYVIDEDELVMEVVEKYWKEFGVTSQIQDAINDEIKKWEELARSTPFYPHYSQTTTTSPVTAPGTWTTNTITCSSATSLPAIDYAFADIACCPTSAANEYAKAYMANRC